MRNFLISVQAVVMAILLVTLAYLPLLVIKGVLILIYRIFPKMPKEKPKWVSTMVGRLINFYEDYLRF